MPHYSIEITDRHTSSIVVDHGFIELVVRRVLVEQSVNAATISVAFVDDAEIRELNRQFLGHDYPTDVISFLLDESKLPGGETANFAHDDGDPYLQKFPTDSADSLDGEIIVSSETAIREAEAHGWSPEAELLLYVVHGLLHLCGYDDLTDEARPVMRSRERELLAIWGVFPTGLEP